MLCRLYIRLIFDGYIVFSGSKSIVMQNKYTHKKKDWNPAKHSNNRQIITHWLFSWCIQLEKIFFFSTSEWHVERHMIDFTCFLKRDPWVGFVKKSPFISPVGQYSMVIRLRFTLSDYRWRRNIGSRSLVLRRDNRKYISLIISLCLSSDIRKTGEDVARLYKSCVIALLLTVPLSFILNSVLNSSNLEIVHF